METLAKEVAVFGVEATIVEPGGARTDFSHRSIQLSRPLTAYDNTPAALLRGLRDPSHLTQGIQAALTERLASIQGQEKRAATTDIPIDSSHHG